MNYSEQSFIEESSLNSTGLLENFFKDFYYELLKCKEIALRTTRLDAELDPQPENVNYTPDTTKEETSSEELENDSSTANTNQHPLLAHEIQNIPVHAVKAADEIQTNLKKVLTEQTYKILHLLDQTDSLQFKEAQYAMIALADEVFLTLPWSGKKIWQKFLLESQIFQSQSSGIQIFQKIDNLLSKYDPSRKSLAFVYFHVLALGFKGNFNEIEDQTVLKNYERRLYAFVHGKNPSLSEYGINKLMPACYERTLVSDVNAKLPDIKFWTLAIILTLLILFFASYVLWHNTVADLYKSLHNIFDQFQIFLNNS